MKRNLWLMAFVVLAGLVANAQKQTAPLNASPNNTLLWRISGNGLQKSSYLFGTMHMLCADDIALSDSLKKAITAADHVYLELDMDNLFEMLGAMQHMTMRGDTTLADLLSMDEYQKVKSHFESKGGLMPFEMLKALKPLLTASLLAEQQSTGCNQMISMDQLVMAEAKRASVPIKGLETMDFQLGIFDKIPYKTQAKQLYQMIAGNDTKGDKNEMQVLTNAYRQQQLDKLEEMTRSESVGMKEFADLLLDSRNVEWTRKLQQLMKDESLVVAVGAGHLPGAKGVINLLRKAGYKVDPVKNDMKKKMAKEI